MSNDFANRNTHMIHETGQVGSVEIADDVVAIIAGLAAAEVEGVANRSGNMSRLGMKNLAKGVRVNVMDTSVSVDLAINLKFGYNIPNTAAAVQERVKNAIENMTGMAVIDVNVKICGVETES